MQFLQQSWQRAWVALGAQPDRALFEQVVDCYKESHRKYHTLQHLRECLEKLQPVLELAEHPGEVELALWFHDAVYELRREDNELQSALWAKRELAASGVPLEAGERVQALVLATRHSALPVSQDERLLVDIDLSILGAEPERFAEYERQVREEYGWVPRWLFRRKRLAVLREFIGRISIFSTEHFHDQLEDQARENLEHSITRLAG
ncbi:HD domain-containing protein [Thauera sinica]|uniref:N-methyl-D-aspartate receptor NMDAR2C subunit n=1 Tax=Thauera sinica TaxID=2665146 RepID=A0ABW1AS93_9RHOO|nr:N-methyl-D-aspartate receptor NMDAR2C subunit [Thauera sp. K11]ATE61478.1 N-methyl-D-aspartate receptor NMDAR2C subunit [Thauera sp. K11]